MSQQRARAVTVFDSDGLRGTIDTASQTLESNSGQVLLHLETGQQVLVPAEELIPQTDGTYTLPFSLSEVTQGQRSGGTTARNSSSSSSSNSGGSRNEPGDYRDRGDSIVMPVVEERLDVQKQRVEGGGVRIRKIVREREEIVDEPLMREEVQVRRVPVGRVVEGPVPVRHVGDTMVISLLEEVLVVEKRLMLKEELHVTKASIETYKPQRVTLRSEEASIERVDAAGVRAEMDDGDNRI